MAPVEQFIQGTETSIISTQRKGSNIVLSIMLVFIIIVLLLLGIILLEDWRQRHAAQAEAGRVRAIEMGRMRDELTRRVLGEPPKYESTETLPRYESDVESVRSLPPVYLPL